MSAKENMSSNKAKQFFVLHGEKVAFGVCLLLVVVFFLLGRGVKSLEENKTPSSLSSRVVAANQHMSSVDIERWREEYEEARKPNFNLTPIVIGGRKPIDDTNYFSFLDVGKPEPQALRSDPNLLPPSKPQVYGLFAAIPVPPRDGLRESPLDLLEPAEEEEEEETTKRKPKRDDRSNDGYGSSGSPGYSYPNYDSKDVGGEASPMVGTETKKYRAITSSIYQRLAGFKGGNGIPEAHSIVIGTATVPIKDQWLEYKRKFEDAIGFDPLRDRPIYMWYQVDRQDVTDSPDGAIDPDAWGTIISYTKNYDDWYQPRYGAGPVDNVDPMYYEGSTGRSNDFALTSPVPYILLQDVEEFTLHPDTPKRKPEVPGESSESDTSEPATGPMPESPSPVDTVTGTGTGSGGGSYSGEGYDVSAGGYGVTEEKPDFDPETGPAAPFKLVRFIDIKAKPGRKYRYRVRVALVDPNNPLQQDQSSSGSTGGAEEGYRPPAVSSPAISSPTFSSGDSSSATVSLLWLEAKSVRPRVEAVQQADIDKYGKRFVEWRFSDWSKNSDIVMVPQKIDKVFAGSVVAPKETRIDENVSFAKDEPTGTLALSEWVPSLAVDVPAKREVALGTVLNFTTKADVLHPIMLQIKRIPEFQFKTDAIVLDMRGGQELPGSQEENVISAPGEFLVIDGEGKLHAQNEIEDMDEFRLKLLMPDEEELEPEVTGYDGGQMEADDDIPMLYDPASSGGRPPRGRSRRSDAGDCP